LGASTAARAWPLGTIIIEAEEGSSFLWFASIQGIEGKQDPADLAPKGCFIAAEAIEREVGKISKTQKTTR
jgi:hypothetical protein